MLYEIITNDNFNEIKDYEGPTPKYSFNKYGYKVANDTIIFYTNYICCPCIYYLKQDDLFAFSFDPDLVVNWAKEHNIELTDNYENRDKINDNIRKHIKPSITKHYKYNLSYIEGWKSVVLNSNGNFIKEEYSFIPFTKDIINNKSLLVKWLDKYKTIINNAIDDKKFIPTITGGLDTRAFIGLYRDRIKELPGYFCSSVKQDGKNNIEQGKLELELAENVVKYIGLKNKRIDDINTTDYVTLSGFFNENANSYSNPNDPEYIYKIVQHAYDNKHQFINKINIFLDDDYLQFKQEGELFRILLLQYLTPDLLFFPFISGTSLYNMFPRGATVYPLLNYQLMEINEIFKKWNN